MRESKPNAYASVSTASKLNLMRSESRATIFFKMNHFINPKMRVTIVYEGCSIVVDMIESNNSKYLSKKIDLLDVGSYRITHYYSDHSSSHIHYSQKKYLQFLQYFQD